MTHYDAAFIGFGKGAKTLAVQLAKQGQKVALVEASNQMYGGTCINIACIPSKVWVHEAEFAAAYRARFPQTSHEEMAELFQKAVEEKRRLIGALRQKNYEKLAQEENITIIDGFARFSDAHGLEIFHTESVKNRAAVSRSEQLKERLTADKIFINTGAVSIKPDIEGMQESAYVYLSDELLDLAKLPRHLLIIGGGYIAQEFASLYASFGVQVSVVMRGADFLPREDKEMAEEIRKALEAKGIRFYFRTEVQKIKDREKDCELELKDGSFLHADAVLCAVGRKANTADLNLEAAGVAQDERGAVKVNEFLQSSQAHIYAMGDVRGALQFTYISLDDSRIVAAHLAGKTSRSAENRGAIPYAVFIEPTFARVGLTEAEALAEGKTIKLARLKAAAVPKANILQKTAGLLKVIIDAETDLILGAHLFAAEAHETINLFKLAIDKEIPYQDLGNAIYTHPTMTEALNELLAESNVRQE